MRRELPDGGQWLALHILLDVCRRHGVTLFRLLGKLKYSWLIEARIEAVVALRFAGFTFPEIGTVMDRDHSTAVHHYETHLASIEVRV